MAVDQTPEREQVRTKLIPGKRHPETGRIERMVRVSADPDGLIKDGPPPIDSEPTSGTRLPKPEEPTDEEIMEYVRGKGNYTADRDAPKDD